MRLYLRLHARRSRDLPATWLGGGECIAPEKQGPNVSQGIKDIWQSALILVDEDEEEGPKDLACWWAKPSNRPGANRKTPESTCSALRIFKTSN